MNNYLKIIIVIVVAITAGLILYNITPEMDYGIYTGLLELEIEGKTIEIPFHFIIGKDSVANVTKVDIYIDERPLSITIETPAIKELKLGRTFNITVSITGLEKGSTPLCRLRISTPGGHDLSYTPTSVVENKVNFTVKILYKTKTTSFIFASSIVLFASASLVPFVLTSIYLTIAMYLTGVIGLADPFQLYMSDICLVFLAGSALELVLRNTGLAERVASILKRVSTSPSKLFLSVFVISGFISMWMSNTSTTYLMLPIVMTLLSILGIENTALQELVLVGLAVGTTAGGIGTIVGTPPNLIATGYINKNIYGQDVITFSTWLIWGVPLFVLRVLIAFILFLVMYQIMGKHEKAVILNKFHGITSEHEARPWSREEILGLAGSLFIALMWLTEQYHGVKTGVAGMIGLLVFLALGVLKPRQVKDLGWDIVILMGGGLTLGRGLMDTGFSDYLASTLTTFVEQPLIAMWLLAFISLFIGTIISSHTAAAAFLAPIMGPIGMSMARFLGISTTLGGALSVLISTLALDFAVALPISTPPSAIVYGTGKVRLKTLFIFGILWGIIGTSLMLLITPTIVISVLG
ncbi:MAG: SLC13 family permease [Desulfurococcaceae archaeon]